ncbi:MULTISPECIES: hypothetical protein [unclassified Acinetobacter]|uniref:hypothetical protein n=1 Tax=unclassified Acinetobacter TaxID=196816 RepID=UPI000E5B5B49|nr:MULTISPECIES: hypothetical protein [unclassified Acinetobacter]RGD90618.1 hypothetical protein DYI96_10670 [Acinetobacter sp. SWAC57]
MKKLLMISASITLLSLTACSKMPKACIESWEKMEKLGKQMGLAEEQLKEQKKKFEEEIKTMNEEEATRMCSTQNSLLGLVGQ